MPPLVIHIFVPLRTQSSPSRRGARAHAATGRCRSRARSGRSSRSPRRRPCAAATPASAPRCRNFQIGNIASEPCTDTKRAQPAVAGLELEAGQAVARPRSCRRSRSPRGACRAGRARRSRATISRGRIALPRTTRRRPAGSGRRPNGGRCRGSSAPRRRRQRARGRAGRPAAAAPSEELRPCFAGGCLGLVELALDEVQALVPEAGVGEVDARRSRRGPRAPSSRRRRSSSR